MTRPSDALAHHTDPLSCTGTTLISSVLAACTNPARLVTNPGVPETGADIPRQGNTSSPQDITSPATLFVKARSKEEAGSRVMDFFTLFILSSYDQLELLCKNGFRWVAPIALYGEHHEPELFEK